MRDLRRIAYCVVPRISIDTKMTNTYVQYLLMSRSAKFIVEPARAFLGGHITEKTPEIPHKNYNSEARNIS